MVRKYVRVGRVSNAASLADYRAALTTPSMRLPVLASLVGRMPIAMVSLALLLFARAELGAFGIASLISGGNLIGVALGAVAQGRLQDRLGPSKPLLVAAAGLIAFGVAELLAVSLNGSPVLLVTLAVAIGLSQPNVSSASRALWPRVLDDERQRQAAYSYEAISQEVFFILGPGIAGGLIALPWHGTGVVVAIVTMAAGAIAFALTPQVRAWGASPGEHASLLGALASPGMRTLAFGALGFGLCIGFVEVAVQAAATRAGTPSIGGLLLSLWSITSVLVGVLYSLRPFPHAVGLRLPVLLTLFGACIGLMSLPGELIGLGAVMLIAGAWLAPQSATHSVLVEVVAPPHMAGEAFAWVITACTLGLSVGQSVSGQLVDVSGPGLAFLAAGGAGVLIACLLALLHRTVRTPDGSRHPEPVTAR